MSAKHGEKKVSCSRTGHKDDCFAIIPGSLFPDSCVPLPSYVCLCFKTSRCAEKIALRHCLHGSGFICNRIGFVAVTPFVYTAPVAVRYQNLVVLNTLSKVEHFQNDTVARSKLAGSRSKYGKSRTECSALLHNHNLICGLTSLLQLWCILLDESHTAEKQAKMS